MEFLSVCIWSKFWNYTQKNVISRKIFLEGFEELSGYVTLSALFIVQISIDLELFLAGLMIAYLHTKLQQKHLV